LPALGADPTELLALAEAAPEPIVIVDAIRNLLKFEDERDNSQVARIINPWVVMQRRAYKTLILAHHERKGGGEHGEGIAGAHALLGSVDSPVELTYERGGSTRRRLHSLARIVQPPDLIYELLQDGKMTALGDPAALEGEVLKTRLLDELGSDGHEWRTTGEITEAMGEPKPSRESVRVALTALATNGKIEREPSLAFDDSGKPLPVGGHTVRWRSANQTSNLQTSHIKEVSLEVDGAEEGRGEMHV
jgi:hypothetical protein